MLKPLGAAGTVLIFGASSVLLALATGPAHHRLVALTDVEPVVVWFLLGGAGVFLPLLVLAAWMVRSEGSGQERVWTGRLRFCSLNRGDLAWSAGGLLGIGMATGLILLGARQVGYSLEVQPGFMGLEPLGPGRLYILALWLPFWLLNIFGEEILWRGVVLPRQEAAFGKQAWLFNGLGWLAFHLAFGLDLLILLAPVTLILPYIVQRRRNSWVGVILHAGLNGPAFLAVAFQPL